MIVRRWMLLAAVLVFGTAFSHEGSARGTELILNHDFPDPAVVKASDGFYYAYGTQGFDESLKSLRIPYNIQIARSSDGVTWKHLGDALPEKPRWARSTQMFWAPHVFERNGTFFMYFSAEPDASTGLCLAVASAQTPEGPFIDRGLPLTCGSTFEDIDPMLFHDPETGKDFLFWGSGFGPIRVREMSESLLSFAKDSREEVILSPVPKAAPFDYLRLVEAPWVLFRDGYYYLFFSGDNCCNPNPHYAVLVARSRSLKGPYELLNSNSTKPGLLLESFDRFLAPGHNSILQIGNETWMYYHAIDKRDPILDKVIPGDRDVRRVMLRTRLIWENHWPKILPPGKIRD